MALPSDSLSSIPITSRLLSPDSLGRTSRIEDFERGGIALDDPSQGRDVQDWRIRVSGTAVKIGPFPGGPETDLFFEAGITEVSLAFDQNMRATVAYVAAGVPKLRYFDTVAGSIQTVNITGGVRTPMLTLDDKRRSQEAASDILLMYLIGTTLRYRQQRERFLTERTLYSGLSATSFLSRLGMGVNLRLQIEIGEAGQIQPRWGYMVAAEAPDVFAATGTVPAVGSMTALELPDSFYSDGELGSFDRLAATEGSDTFAADGIVFTAGYRYWRMVDIGTSNSYLEISELRLTEGGVDQTSGTISASVAPTSGAVSDIYDGNLSSRNYWLETTVETPGFYIQWDFGAGIVKNIDGFKQGGFDTNGRHVLRCVLLYSTDGTNWFYGGSAGTPTDLAYPGNNTLSANIPFDQTGYGASTYRYWRLRATANDGNADHTSMGELKLLIGTFNQALRKTATASTENGAGDNAPKAVDGNTGSEWVTSNGAAFPHWLAVDLVYPRPIKSYLVQAQRVVPNRTPTAWKLQGNNTDATDGAPWVDVDTRSGQTAWSAFEERTYTLT